MGHYKQAALEFQRFPQTVLVDIEEIFLRLRRDVAMLWPQPVDWDLFFSVIFPDALCETDRWFNNPHHDHQLLKECARHIARGEHGIFEGIYESTTIDALEKIVYRSGLEIKDHLMELVAYHRGVFPYTFRTMISDGCLFFSKNESIYDSPVLDSQF